MEPQNRPMVNNFCNLNIERCLFGHLVPRQGSERLDSNKMAILYSFQES